MRDHRIAVGVSMEAKIREHGFFLTQIVATSRAIEEKHIRQDHPINWDVDRLNYFFSAYLNTTQSLKDGSQTATGSRLSWREFSPTYGSLSSLFQECHHARWLTADKRGAGNQEFHCATFAPYRRSWRCDHV
jgi:hypothetical protein